MPVFLGRGLLVRVRMRGGRACEVEEVRGCVLVVRYSVFVDVKAEAQAM